MREGDSASSSDATDLRRQLPLPEGYTNVRNAGSETEWLQPAYVGEQLSTQSRIVDIVARQGRAGLGIYITQEEQILNSHQRDRHAPPPYRRHVPGEEIFRSKEGSRINGARHRS